MPFLEHGENKIAYETWVPSETHSSLWVTLVNGYTRPLSDFKGMGRYLSERGFSVVALDNRGAGAAECSPTFTLDEMTDDLFTLWDHLGCANSHLFAIGLGAAIAVIAAARSAERAPGRLRSLILVSPPASDAEFAVEAKGPSRDPRRLQAELARYFSHEFIARERVVVQGFMRQMGKVYQEPDTALGARAQRGAMEEFDLKPLLAQIKVPALILQGEADGVIPLASGKAVAAGISGARLETFPRVGYLLLAEMPLKLYEIVEAFCREIDDGK